jgi:hypothetical protein
LTSQSTLQQVCDAFSFLTERGYSIVSEQDEGLFGEIEYRSPEVWVVINWDLRDRTMDLAFASTHRTWFGRVSWDAFDHLLRGAERFEPEPPFYRNAPLGELVEFVRRNLREIERRLSNDQREATVAFLARLEADRVQRARAYSV